MTYLFAALILLTGILIYNNKVLSTLFIIILIVWGGTVCYNADYFLYEFDYNNYNILKISEPFFRLILKTFNDLGFSYSQFRFIIIMLMILSYFFVVKKLTPNTTNVIMLYTIFPFCINITQLRFAMALPFLYVGIYLLLKNKERNLKNIIGYVLCIILGGLIHTSIFLFILFLIPIIFKKNWKKILIVLLVISILFVFTSSVLSIVGNNLITKKINFVLKRSTEGTNGVIRTHLGTFVKCSIWLAIYFVIHEYMKRKIYKYMNERDKFIDDSIFKFNICSIVFLPWIFYVTDLCRLYEATLLINYVSLSFFYSYYKIAKIPNSTRLLYTLSTTILPLTVLVTIVLTGNIGMNYVFLKLFNSSTLF